MFRCIRFTLICVAAVLFLCFALPISAQVMAVREDSQHDVSAPLVEMAVAAQKASEGDLEKAAGPAPPVAMYMGSHLPAGPGAVGQTKAFRDSAELAPATGLSFEGLGNGFPGFTVNFAAPDP